MHRAHWRVLGAQLDDRLVAGRFHLVAQPIDSFFAEAVRLPPFQLIDVEAVGDQFMTEDGVDVIRLDTVFLIYRLLTAWNDPPRKPELNWPRTAPRWRPVPPPHSPLSNLTHPPRR